MSSPTIPESITTWISVPSASHLVNGAVYYRLLWRGEILPEEEVEALVDRVLAGARSSASP